jgi:branched-chain amino acid aminotransferase
VPDNKSYAFFKGNFVPMEEAKVSIMNHTFMYGTGVFEGIRAYWNGEQEELYLFRLHEHFERMFDSMKIMHMAIKYSMPELCRIVVELLARNAPKTDMYVRPCAYKDSERIGPSLEDVPTEICIFTVPFGDYFHGAPGLKVCTSSWRRVEDNAIPARGKIVGAYANTALAKTDAILAGFDDCIVLSENGHVSEGSAMNLFLVKDGVLHTPTTFDNILEGVTRATVFELAETELKVKAVGRSIDRSELYTADELFVCGTGAQITPVVEIDRRPINDGKPGPLTTLVHDQYISICRGTNPKFSQWRTPVYKKSIADPASKGKVATKSQ